MLHAKKEGLSFPNKPYAEVADGIKGQVGEEERALRLQATAHKLPVLYCNQVGGNDELIFDGLSLALAADGRLLAQCKGFQEDMAVVDLPLGGQPATPPSRSRCDGRGCG